MVRSTRGKGRCAHLAASVVPLPLLPAPSHSLLSAQDDYDEEQEEMEGEGDGEDMGTMEHAGANNINRLPALPAPALLPTWP